MIEKEDLLIPSSDKIHTLKGSLWFPSAEPKGILQVVHGMTDYTDRYEAILRAVAEAGFVAFGVDLLGHGRTAEGPEEFGFFGKGGHRLLVQDVIGAAEEVKKRFGETLPFCLMGHSMGSFVARCAVAEGFLPDSLILVGTSGHNPAAPLGVILSDLIALCKGPHHVSPLMHRLIFADYDDRFPGDYPKRWISVDTENLVRYKDDPFCTFSFTVSALGDLIRLNQRAGSRSFYQNAKGTRTLLLSGEMDPVGDFGKGVREVFCKLQKNGAEARLRLFPDFRHEILQDFCKEECIEEILNFIR
ncbi:MAG: alpha/beta fold hydrolase [Clostridia bacterium]|nr:alpha/beta fold hydrolase [Clostridia bacterium]